MNQVAIEIVLVEDNDNDIELSLHALRAENLGNAIHIARDGEEALQVVDGWQREHEPEPLPKLVLLDLKLPKVDGLEVLRRIKSHPSTKAVPVVVLTSSSRDPDLVEAYRLGANSYIQKPVEFGEFRKIVKQLGLYWLLINCLPSVENLVTERSGKDAAKQ